MDIILIIVWLHYIKENRNSLLEIETLVLSIQYRHSSLADCFLRAFGDQFISRVTSAVSSCSPRRKPVFWRRRALLAATAHSSSCVAGRRAGRHAGRGAAWLRRWSPRMLHRPCTPSAKLVTCRVHTLQREQELSLFFIAAIDHAWNVHSAISLSVLPGFMKAWPAYTWMTGRVSCQSKVLCCDFMSLLNELFSDLWKVIQAAASLSFPFHHFC